MTCSRYCTTINSGEQIFVRVGKASDSKAESLYLFSLLCELLFFVLCLEEQVGGHVVAGERIGFGAA
jgi:hypothetical protein